jgi:hypothetical protein
MGRLAGTVQTVPESVALRLLDAGQARVPTEDEMNDAAGIETGDPVVTSRDPSPARRGARR